jgi:hypothetical protein
VSRKGADSASTELGTVVRKEAVTQVAKWAVGSLAIAVVCALAGWAFYFEGMAKDYIRKAAGGVPAGAIIASKLRCEDLSGTWSTFTEGTGRFLIGAGKPTNPGYETWEPEGGGPAIRLTERGILTKGGEETHKLTEPEMPEHAHDYTLRGGTANLGGSATPVWVGETNAKTRTAGGNREHNNIPPFVGVFFCLKG